MGKVRETQLTKPPMAMLYSNKKEDRKKRNPNLFFLLKSSSWHSPQNCLFSKTLKQWNRKKNSHILETLFNKTDAQVPTPTLPLFHLRFFQVKNSSFFTHTHTYACVYTGNDCLCSSFFLFIHGSKQNQTKLQLTNYWIRWWRVEKIEIHLPITHATSRLTAPKYLFIFFQICGEGKWLKLQSW